MFNTIIKSHKDCKLLMNYLLQTAGTDYRRVLLESEFRRRELLMWFDDVERYDDGTVQRVTAVFYNDVTGEEWSHRYYPQELVEMIWSARKCINNTTRGLREAYKCAEEVHAM